MSICLPFHFILFLFFLSCTKCRILELQCESYKSDNPTFNSTSNCISENNKNNDNKKKPCFLIENCSSGQSCFVVWNNRSGDIEIKRSGCFATAYSDLTTSNSPCSTECIDSTNPISSSHFFCCCTSNHCNSKFSWAESSNEFLFNSQSSSSSSSSSSKTSASSSSNSSNYSNTIFVLLYIFVPCLTLSVVALAALTIIRQRKVGEFISLSNDSLGHHRRRRRGEDGVSGRNSPETPLLSQSSSHPREIQLIEIKASGRFGAVWKALHKESLIAVKIFSLQDKESWLSEQEIYNLPQMTHDCILNFLGVERKGENLNMEFWLTTTFHELGSLCDYLKAKTVSWDELIRIAQSMARGLTHLHEEIPGDGSKLGMKPALAHRDFKSKNVLLKSDLTACIGDFGLALVFEPGKSCGDTHGQVGTRRYMAPEVLEGAINFSRDAFLRIDMYACGLVLWELVSRLKWGSLVPSDYKLPFEAEANHPTLEEMQDLVVTRNVRPALLPSWRSTPGLSSLTDTIEECWDHDAEARLSASCVTERIKGMQNYSHDSNEISFSSVDLTTHQTQKSVNS